MRKVIECHYSSAKFMHYHAGCVKAFRVATSSAFSSSSTSLTVQIRETACDKRTHVLFLVEASETI